jgi:ATP-binding cassette subfamily B protein
LNEKLTAQINLMLMEKANQFPELTPFEDAKFYDELRLIREDASFRPLQLIDVLRLDSRELFTTLAILLLLVPLSGWVPLLILLTTLPHSLQSAWRIASWC